MKRYLKVLVLALLLGASGSLAIAASNAPPAATRDSPVAFGTTIADLDRAARSGDDRSIPGGRLLVIDAEIGSITARADSDDAFTAEVELIGGEWNGEERVDLYRAYAVFDSPRFRDHFSRRSSSRLLPGDRIIVLCRYLGIGVDYDETTPVAVLEAVDLRRTH